MPYEAYLRPTDTPLEAMSVDLDPPELGFRREMVKPDYR